MRVRDYLKGEAVAVEHCCVRGICPLGALCATTGEEGMAPLFPSVIDIEQGEMLWTDLRSEHRVFIVRAGVFSCAAHVEEDREVPFALYGCGLSLGLPELYIPRSAADTYHFRALTPGRVCSFPAKPVRRRLESVEGPFSQKVLSSSLVNLSTAMLIQTMIVSKPLLRDRIVLLLASLQELAGRGEGGFSGEWHITHGEIGDLVMSDRVSATRALHKMEEEGLVELGYRSIRIGDAVSEGADSILEVCRSFYNVGDLS